MTHDSASDKQQHADPPAQEFSAGSGAGGVPHPASERGSACAAGGKSLAMRPLRGLILGLLAGLIVWGTLHGIMPVFTMPPELAALQGPEIAPKLPEIRRESYLARWRNATLSLVILAAVLGLALTGGELLARGRPGRAVVGGLLAGGLAGAVAIGAALIGAELSGSLGVAGNPNDPAVVPPLVKLLLVQGTVLGIIGLGIGLAMALVMASPRPVATCVVGCVLGGLMAALVFVPVVSFFLPDTNTEDLVPDSGIGRLLWLGLATGLVALTVTGLSKEKPAAQAA